MGNKSKRHFLLLLGIIFTEVLLKSKVGRKIVGSYKKYEDKQVEELRSKIKGKKVSVMEVTALEVGKTYNKKGGGTDKATILSISNGKVSYQQAFRPTGHLSESSIHDFHWMYYIEEDINI